MSDSPYTSPTTPPASMASANQGPDREKLRRVARYQRYVIFALLSNIILNIVSLASGRVDPSVRLALLGLIIVVGLLTMFSTFMLGKEVVHVVIAVFCSLLMVIPCISLMVLLVLNQRATTFLQRHGVRVGFLGTDPNTI